MKLTPKNWRDFQHYKDRNPPWIRLHKSLLDNYEYQCLPVASRALAPMLWLLPSDSMDGVIDATPSRLAFRLRMSEADVLDALKPLIDNGFFDVASGVLAERKQSAVPETETETEQKETLAPTGPPGFQKFWKAWPTHKRKAARGQCERKWESRECEPIAARVLQALEASKASDDWQKDSGQFIPAPLVWLNESRWEAHEEIADNWHASSLAVKAKAKELGLPAWDGIEQWVFFKARVVQASKEAA